MLNQRVMNDKKNSMLHALKRVVVTKESTLNKLKTADRNSNNQKTFNQILLIEKEMNLLNEQIRLLSK